MKLTAYYGGWYNPEAKKGKYKKMTPNPKIQIEISVKLDSIIESYGVLD